MSMFHDKTVTDQLKQIGEASGTDLLGDIIKIYREDCPKTLQLVKESLTEKNFMQAGRWAHKLKSSAANLGFNQLSELCQRMEKLGDQQDPNLEIEMNDVSREIETMLNSSMETLDKIA